MSSPKTPKFYFSREQIFEATRNGILSIKDAQAYLGDLRKYGPTIFRGADEKIIQEALQQGILTTEEARELSKRQKSGDSTELVVQQDRSKVARQERNEIYRPKAFERGVVTKDDIAGKHPNLELDSGIFTFLPNELVLMIFEVLLEEDPITLLRSVPLVCKKLRWLCAGVRGKVEFDQKKVLTRYKHNPHLKIVDVAARFPDPRFPMITWGTSVNPTEAREQLQRLMKLYVTDIDLTMLPRSIELLRKLKILHVTGNQVTLLPDSIGNLRALTMLNVSSNQLIALPHSIGDLKRLTKLIVSQNNLTTLPKSIGGLAQLKNLDVFKNHLIALPDSIGDLTALETLKVSSNQLTKLPDSIGTLQQLKNLWVSYNQLTELPNSIGDLQQLTILYIICNELTALPTEIGQLTALTTLNVSENQLTKLPDSIGRLTVLRNLNVSSNKLTALPDSIVRLKNLETLDVSSNRLAVLPQKFENLTMLRKLNVYDNPWTVLPQEITRNMILLRSVITYNSKVTLK